MYRYRTAYLAIFLSVFWHLTVTDVSGTPCTENTRTCDTATQFCVEQNGTASGFSCECLQADQQIAADLSCVPVPESQRLYVATPLNFTGVNTIAIAGIMANATIPQEALRDLFSSVRTYKTAIFLQFLSGPSLAPRTVQFSLLFTEEVTPEIRHDVARVLLAIEAFGKVIVDNVTFGVVGYSGIFDDKSKLDSGNDDIDWCSFPDLLSCRDHTTCVDVGLRYQCPCEQGYVDVGDFCYGTTISGPQSFSTDGTRDLQLSCDPGDVTKVTSLAWNVTCAQKSDGVFKDSICTLRPNPKFDDGMVVACFASYTGGLSASSTFTVSLNYPPETAPMIEGYESGKVVAAGQRLRMTCTVSGGKPLVTSVDFSCPGHPDVEPDDVTKRAVISTLTIGALAAEDDGILCECSAVWKDSDAYTLTSNRILAVGESEDDALSNSTVVIIAAASAGGVIVIAIVVVFIIWRRRGEGGRRKERLGRDNTYNKPERDPEPNRFSDPYTGLRDPSAVHPGAVPGPSRCERRQEPRTVNMTPSGGEGFTREGSGTYDRVIPPLESQMKGDSGYLNPVAATADHPFSKGGNFNDARSPRGGPFSNPREPFDGPFNPRFPAEGIVNPSAPRFRQGGVAHNPMARGGDVDLGKWYPRVVPKHDGHQQGQPMTEMIL